MLGDWIGSHDSYVEGCSKMHTLALENNLGNLVGCSKTSIL
jgi:hypothetical protein